MFRRGPGRLEMCFYAYKNVLEPMGHLGANLIFSILTLNQVGGESQYSRSTLGLSPNVKEVFFEVANVVNCSLSV